MPNKTNNSSSIANIWNGGPTLGTVFATNLAQEFYETDVTPRAKRERGLLNRRAYPIPKWNHKVSVYQGSEDGMHSQTWDYPGIKGYYNGEIHINPDGSDISNTIVHEQAHADQYKYRDTDSKLRNFFDNGYLGMLKNLVRGEAGKRNITASEESLLNQAYQVSDPSSSSNDLMEKHASNRDMRFTIWKELRNILGRTPTLEETDAYIKSMSKEDLQRMIRSGYEQEYIQHENFNTYDTQNALMHVAHNSQQSPSQTTYAKQGGILNYSTYFK